MSASCCEEISFDGDSIRYKRALWTVIAINAVMFFVEISASFVSGSQALQADALDFLADSVTYTVTILVVGKSLKARANAALFKGASLAFMGLGVLVSTVYHLLNGGVPGAEVMGVTAGLALAANLASVIVLIKFRDGDSNVRSVWICTRNDALGNIAVLFAAWGVWEIDSALPDLIVAGFMASLFLYGSVQIVRHALRDREAGVLATGSASTC
ncbi:MAG: cation transporter [Pseudomonadales bacterium]|nr:cation transporter [Pseudomonadales bacterium]